MITNCKHCNKEYKYSPHHNMGIYCSIECDHNHRISKKEILFEERYVTWLAGGDIGIKNPRKLIREFLIKRDGYKCTCCGITEWHGKDITLWADHIDGDATNNKPDNFRLICPNCDSQSETFGAKNYGKGRKSRGLPQYG